MEKEKNSINWTAIIIAVIIGAVIIIVALSAENNNQLQTNQTPVDTSVQTPATQSPQTKIQATTQSSQSQCDTDAKAYMAKQWKLNDYQGYKTLNLTYKSHYNQSNNACYVLVSYNFIFTSLSGVEMTSSISYKLANISSKNINGFATDVGNYQIDKFPDGTSNLLACNVEGMQCNSVDGFLTFTKPYMGE